jgi:hypothetical protein
MQTNKERNMFRIKSDLESEEECSWIEKDYALKRHVLSIILACTRNMLNIIIIIIHIHCTFTRQRITFEIKHSENTYRSQTKR